MPFNLPGQAGDTLITEAQPRSKTNRHSVLEMAGRYGYILPAIIIVGVITVLPLLNTIIISFQSYKLARPQDREFVGLANYLTLFSEPRVGTAVTNTVIYTLVTVITSLVLGLAIAILIQGLTIGKPLLRAIFVAPMLLTPAVVGVMWRFLLNAQAGIFNYFSSSLGFGNPDWLGTPGLAMFSIIVVDVWQWTPYVFLVMLAGLESLPQEYLEAAHIDGASSWQRFRYIVLPYLTPLLLIATLFRFTWAFRGFDHIYTLTQGGPGNATETLALSVWRTGFVGLDLGVASAISVVMMLVLTIFSLVILRSLSRQLKS
ncbi:MAG: binding-protein-dependent transport system inner rane component [Chloroflexi bacterium]|jgi:multiple sugar transport system permease protein|nr:binding-protein-dependent transport system inner rane component [Chloroflexota bacterium]